MRQAENKKGPARSTGSARRVSGSVAAGGDRVQFEMRIVDARSGVERDRDTRRGRPAGNLVILVPGHGQTVDGPHNLLAAAARLSRSGVACCIDPVPAQGGDRAEAEALAAIARATIDYLFPTAQGPLPIRATLVGWSHGGGEALRAANWDSDLFPQYLGLCPTGLVERRPVELVGRFFLEAARILSRSLVRGNWRRVVITLRLGANALAGLAQDLARSRSLRRLLADVRWACRKVPGPAFGYSGQVVLLFGESDSVVRWRDAFPGGDSWQAIADSLPAFARDNFPFAGRLEVRVLPGDHVSPEADTRSFLRTGLGLLSQLSGTQ